MNSDQASLTALQRTLSNGSKLIVAGAVSAVSGALLDLLIRTGQDPGTITPTGLNIPLPANYAIVVFMIISGASGWAGWAYLRGAQRLMHRLEFSNGVNPEEIKTALTGSSLASASIFLLKFLCVFTVFTSSSIIVGVVYFLYILHSLNIAPSVFIFSIVLSMMGAPYLLVFGDIRMRYFQPSKWDSLSWLFRLLLKGFIDQFTVSVHLKNYKSLPTHVSRKDAIELLNDLERYLPIAMASVLNILIRKHGFMFIFQTNKMEAIFDEKFWVAIEKKTDEILNRKFPDAEPELHATLKEYLLNLLYEVC